MMMSMNGLPKLVEKDGMRILNIKRIIKYFLDVIIYKTEITKLLI
jgi:hypothetical protein